MNDDNAVLPMAYSGAEIGDVLQHPADRPIPDEWHLLDGSVKVTAAWPDFARAMRIKGGSFTLPKPQRQLPGQVWVIKLGQHRPVPVTPASAFTPAPDAGPGATPVPKGETPKEIK